MRAQILMIQRIRLFPYLHYRLGTRLTARAPTSGRIIVIIPIIIRYSTHVRAPVLITARAPRCIIKVSAGSPHPNLPVSHPPALRLYTARSESSVSSTLLSPLALISVVYLSRTGSLLVVQASYLTTEDDFSRVSSACAITKPSG